MMLQITVNMKRYVIKPERSIFLGPPDFVGSTFNTKTARGYVVKYINRPRPIPGKRYMRNAEQINAAVTESNIFNQYSLFSSFMLEILS
jgi:hypothetical protein